MTISMSNADNSKFHLGAESATSVCYYCTVNSLVYNSAAKLMSVYDAIHFCEKVFEFLIIPSYTRFLRKN